MTDIFDLNHTETKPKMQQNSCTHKVSGPLVNFTSFSGEMKTVGSSAERVSNALTNFAGDAMFWMDELQQHN